MMTPSTQGKPAIVDKGGISRTERLRQSYRKAFDPAKNRKNLSNPEEESQYLVERSRSVNKLDSFQQMQEFRSKLPAADFKRDFLEQLSKSQVIVVSGETGCGKTTQIPQFILENAVANEMGESATLLYATSSFKCHWRC